MADEDTTGTATADQDASSSLSSWQWIFYGNMVVPTGNPFQQQQQQESSVDPPSNDDAHTHWIGPGLKLCLNHVLIVDRRGIIVHFAPLGRERQQQQDDDDDELSVYESHDGFIRLSRNDFLCPGYIDLHIHAPQFTFTGTATDKPLMGPRGWLETYTFPTEQSLRHDLNKATDVYDRVVSTTLDAGTTTAVYFATLHVEPCMVLVDRILRHGQRAFVGKVCMDRNSPNDYVQSLDENIQQTRTLIEYIHQRAGKEEGNEKDENETSLSSSSCVATTTLLPLVMPIVTPRFIPTCTPSLMDQLGQVARQYNCHIQSHISESIDEVTFSRQLDAMDHDGRIGQQRHDATIFDSHRLLTDRCIMAHGPYVTETCMELLERRGTAIAHCPLSNFFFAGGKHLPCRRLMERNVKVGLGTDVAGGYSPSVANAARMAVLASRTANTAYATTTETGDDDCNNNKNNNLELDYRHAFYLATLGGAQALGLDDRIGTFAVGMEFDAIVLSVSWPIHVFDTDSVQDVFQKLCTLGDDRHVTQVYVRGRPVKKRKQQ